MAECWMVLGINGTMFLVEGYAQRTTSFLGSNS